MKLLKTLLLISLYCLVSCNKKEIQKTAFGSSLEMMQSVQNSGNMSTNELYNYFYDQADGRFIIMHQKGYYSLGDGSFNIKGEYKTNSVQQGGNLVISNADKTVTITPTTGNVYSSYDATLISPLYNKNNSITASYVEDNTTKSLQTQFYIPKPLSLSANQNFITVQNGKQINWETDPAGNGLYVMISLRFNPLAYENASLGLTGNPVYNNILLSDAGSYTFSNSDFTKFPNGAYISMDVYRGNIATQSSNNKNFILSAFSMVLLNSQVVK